MTHTTTCDPYHDHMGHMSQRQDRGVDRMPKMPVFLLVFLLVTESLASNTADSVMNVSDLVPMDSRCIDQQLIFCRPVPPPNGTCPAGTSPGARRDGKLTAGSTILYLVLLALPVFFSFPILVLLNIQLTSGARHSFIFFYQVLAIVVLLDSNPQFAYLHSGFFIWGFLAFNAIFSSLLATDSLHYLILNYFLIIYILIFVLAVFLIQKCYRRLLPHCHSCWMRVQDKVRRWKKSQGIVDGSVIQGLCSIFLLTYMSIVQSSFTLLIGSECCCGHETCPRFCQDIGYLSNEHAPFYGVAIGALTLCAAVPFTFICYPTVPNIIRRLRGIPGPKPEDSRPRVIQSIFDAFQGVYKPQFRFFAGLHFLYRITLWAAFALIPKLELRTFVVSAHIVVILIIHSIVQPFKERKHNYYEGLMLLNLLIILEVSQGIFFVPQLSDRKSLEVLIYILALIPLVYGIAYIVIKIVQRRCRRRRRHQLQVSQPIEGDEGVGDESVQNRILHEYVQANDEK